MKKLLGIVVLGLLLSGNVNAETLYYDCKTVSNPSSHDYIRYIINSGSDKLNVSYKWNDDYYNKYIGKRIVSGDPRKSSTDRNIISDNGKMMTIEYKNSNIKFNYKTDGKVFVGNRHALNCFKTSKFLSDDEKKQVEITSLIDKAKSTCKSLGFKDGTEKFADCSLKLYSQSVEIAAEQNKTVVMQPQSSGSNVMTIYDPVRDSNALMNKGMKMLSGGCTLGVNC